MDEIRRREVVDAARAFEQIVAAREEYYANLIRCHEARDHDARAHWRRKLDDIEPDLEDAEKQLARRFHGRDWADLVRVGEVIYLAFSASTLLRIPLADIPDLAVMPAEEGH
jgi:hypothetical protein